MNCSKVATNNSQAFPLHEATIRRGTVTATRSLSWVKRARADAQSPHATRSKGK
jgi:hypothetical protein